MSSGVTVRALVVSSFALDGGAMHGIVPRTLWERVHPADARHRIALVARALLVDHAASGERTLIELGMGQRWSEKERGLYALAPGPDVPAQLAAIGVDPESITRVLLTHLHWDHAGGLACTDPADGSAQLAFPDAEHVVSEVCLRHATAATTREAVGLAAGLRELLLTRARLRVYRPGEPLAPGLEGRLVGGHTDGHIVPLARHRDDGPPLAFPTDLVPTRSHLRAAWVMGYDAHPHALAEEKRALFEELATMGGGVCLYHDPEVEAAWATRNERGVELTPGPLAGPN